MRVRRLNFSFLFLFVLFTISIFFTFKNSSEAKINTFYDLKGSRLPIISVKTKGMKPIKSKEDYKKADFYVFDNFDRAHKTFLAFQNKTDSYNMIHFTGKIRGRGNSTWVSFDQSKRSYLLKFDETHSMFGLPAARKWILQANLTDKTSLRNVYAYFLGRSIFKKVGWTPRTQFVHLFVNDKYLGLYAFMEKAEVADSRIELPFGENDDSFFAEVNSRLNRAWNFKSDRGVNLSIREKENAGNEYYRNAEKILKDFENVLFSEDFSDPIKGYRPYIDIDTFVDWYLVNEFTKNHDAAFQDSCFLTYSSADKKIRMGPLWDFDISCGNNKGECADPEGLFIQSRHWYARLWEDFFFREKVRDRWAEVRDSVRSSFYWLAFMADCLEDDANLEDKIWQRFGFRQWPNAPGYKERKTYRAEVDYLKSWIKARADWFDKEFGIEK